MKLTKKAFYILSFTWGLFYNIAGAFVALGMIITGHKPKKWGWSWYFEAGKNWGGADWGIFFVTGRNSSNDLKSHEFGHAIQNCFLGPLMIPLVNVPSSFRYWTRRLMEKAGKKPKKEYDDIWFERQATELGTVKIKQLENLSKNTQKKDKCCINSIKSDN